jgi:acetate kinase
MRELEASNGPNATVAIDYFIYRAGLNAGMLVTALRELDAFVFTARIVVNSVQIPARVAEKLAWLGAIFDSSANALQKTPISRPESPSRPLRRAYR